MLKFQRSRRRVISLFCFAFILFFTVLFLGAFFGVNSEAEEIFDEENGALEGEGSAAPRPTRHNSYFSVGLYRPCKNGINIMLI